MFNNISALSLNKWLSFGESVVAAPGVNSGRNEVVVSIDGMPDLASVFRTQVGSASSGMSGRDAKAHLSARRQPTTQGRSGQNCAKNAQAQQPQKPVGFVSRLRQLGPIGVSMSQSGVMPLTKSASHKPRRQASMSLMAQALMRGFLVVLLVIFPATMLPGTTTDMAQGMTLIALLAGLAVAVEYTARYPGLLEFRDAKPYNRTRFALLSVLVGLLTLVQRSVALDPQGSIPQAIRMLGQMFDFPFSPVRVLAMSLPVGLPSAHVELVLAAGAMVFVVAILGLAAFVVALHMRYWPKRSGVLNVWVNLPNFDPTKGVDVVQRLERKGQINILVGLTLPFSLPALLHVSNLLVQPMTLQAPLSFVWVIALWAFLPVSLIMRGAAMYRVSQLIRAQRRSKAAEEAAIPLPARSAYS